MWHTHDVLAPLVAIAERDLRGEKVSWSRIDRSITEFVAVAEADPAAHRALRAIEDREVTLTLDDWFWRAGVDRMREARTADRLSEKIFMSIQVLGAVMIFTSTAVTVTGTPDFLAMVSIGVASCALLIVATVMRRRLDRRASTAAEACDTIANLSLSAGQGRSA